MFQTRNEIDPILESLTVAQESSSTKAELQDSVTQPHPDVLSNTQTALIQESATHKEDKQSHSSIFVGNLDICADATILSWAFSAFGEVTEIRPFMNKENGLLSFGFATFQKQANAVRALSFMNGKLFGSSATRCDWARLKEEERSRKQAEVNTFSHDQSQTINLDIDAVIQQATPAADDMLGDLHPYTTKDTIRSLSRTLGLCLRSVF
jgi:nucleolysin TIA-1/TIAR